MIIKTVKLVGEDLNELCDAIEDVLDFKIALGGRQDGKLPVYRSTDDQLFEELMEDDLWIVPIETPCGTRRYYKWEYPTPIFYVKNIINDIENVTI